MNDPVSDIWPDEAIEAIHLASLALLERAGVKVESPAATALLLGAGCSTGAGGRVLVPRGVVADALAACPRDLHARRARPRAFARHGR